MRFPIRRLAALVATAAFIWSCDGGPTVTRFGSGISGGPTGTAPVVPPAPGDPDTEAPLVRIQVPVATPIQLINVGDSILVVARLNDDRGVARVTFTGLRMVGDPDLGTFQEIQRYRTVVAPGAGASFRAGLTDTIVRRYIHPATPLDTTLDSLIIVAVLTDASGNTHSERRRVDLVTGPEVDIISPTTGDEVPQGRPMTVQVSVEHLDGVDELTLQVAGEAGWPTPLNETIQQTFPANTTIDTFEVSVTVPADAPLGGRITINASAVDVNGNPGSAAPVTVTVRAVGTLPPRVYQTVPAKLEMSDFITVTAHGDGIRTIGRILYDRGTGVEISRFDTTFAAPFGSPRTVQLPLNLGLDDQGRKLHVVSYALDDNTPQLTGYSLPAGINVPTSNEAAAHRDTTLVTHGRTFALPRNGVVGDVAVDPLGNVFLSNTQFNLLEVWQNQSKGFAANGIAVGSLPWGLFLSSDPDTLLVANSGATTISRVFVGTTTPASMREDLPNRIRTRETVVFQVRYTRDDATGVIKLAIVDQVAYSDRPQYVVESQGGRVYYSTRPTSSATPGTIRWLDPSLPFPDPQQIHNYGVRGGGADAVYTIFNADSIAIEVNAVVEVSDVLHIYDHPYGQIGPDFSVSDSIPLDAAAKAVALQSDVQLVANLELGSLALTDTTFVAASGDRTWIGFGEGNTAGGPGRLMMVNDPVGPAPGFFSPSVTVVDLVHNASEKVFGMAIDSTGLQVTSHGLQTYMAALDVPFHLRLEGVYDSFDNGAGVAYHPRAKSTLSQPDHRVSFSATTSGVVEIIDVAHYNNRGRLVTKGNFYGPLRVSGPLPGDPPTVILKLFALTDGGLVVIDLQAGDINPAP
ncbi:MAG: hypothetical protein WD801_08895 [Gemmatimonadaceae bacterium]